MHNLYLYDHEQRKHLLSLLTIKNSFPPLDKQDIYGIVMVVTVPEKWRPKESEKNHRKLGIPDNPKKSVLENESF